MTSMCIYNNKYATIYIHIQAEKNILQELQNKTFIHKKEAFLCSLNRNKNLSAM